MDVYNKLSRLALDYPELIFDSCGYQELPQETIDANRKGFDEVSRILKDSVENFVSFQNFKPRRDGSLDVRCQTRWSPLFTGVTYIKLEDFKN